MKLCKSEMMVTQQGGAKACFPCSHGTAVPITEVKNGSWQKTTIYAPIMEIFHY